MRVIYKLPGKDPERLEIDNTHKVLQDAVGGLIEIVPMPGREGAVIICNEEGKLLGLKGNIICEGQVICGPIVVCGVDGEEFCDVPEDAETAWLQPLAHAKYEWKGWKTK